MDQQAASSLPGDVPEGRPPARPPPVPLRPLALSLSLFGIAGGALLICCLLAVAALLWLVADLGREGASDLYQDLRFDTVLKTQVGAFVVSGLYLGVAIATVGAAVLRGRRDWGRLVALDRVRHWRDLAVIAAITLVYITLATYAVEHARDRSLLISGPTDVLLAGTIVVNLVILAPVAEELLFRGWLYTGLRGRLGFAPSFLLTVASFAAIHWDPGHRRILQVLPLAIALGILRERAGSIKPTIALHAVYNLIIIGIRLAYS
jgi:membrane protease YdiL (CAAX protease family)